MKTCTKCHQEKPLSDFGNHRRMSDGLRATCKQCNWKPPRTNLCAACGEVFEYRSHGKPLHVCATCRESFHWCHVCKSAKPLDQFYRQSTAASKIGYRCKPCVLQQSRSYSGVRSRKAASVRSRYGLSIEEYESLLDAPDGVCPCCGRSGCKKMVMDHDHETGLIRGVICSACNSGIGLLGDSIEGLLRAVKYLESR